MKKRFLFFIVVLVSLSLIVWSLSNWGSAAPKHYEEKGAVHILGEGQALPAEYTPSFEGQRATLVALHGTQIAQEAIYAQPTPLFPPGYEGPYPTIPIPTVHSDEFLPSPISWRLLWQGELTIIQAGVIGESGVSQGKSGLLIWWPPPKNSIEIVPLADTPLPITRMDIVTVCKPFVVVTGRVKQVNTKPYVWVYDLSKKSVRSVTRSQAPCWDPSYEQRDPTKLGK